MRERTTHAAGDKTIRRYVHGPVTDEIIRQDFFSSGGSIKSVFHHHDLLGSNLCLSDTTGNAVEYYRYTAFGFPTILDTNLNAIPATKFGNRHLYTGREWLRELSQADHRNRHYTPHLARWTATDPIKFDAGDVNLYRYCENGSLFSIDPYGLEKYSCNCQEDLGRYKDLSISLELTTLTNYYTFQSVAGNAIKSLVKSSIESAAKMEVEDLNKESFWGQTYRGVSSAVSNYNKATNLIGVLQVVQSGIWVKQVSIDVHFQLCKKKSDGTYRFEAGSSWGSWSGDLQLMMEADRNLFADSFKGAMIDAASDMVKQIKASRE